VERGFSEPIKREFGEEPLGRRREWEWPAGGLQVIVLAQLLWLFAGIGQTSRHLVC